MALPQSDHEPTATRVGTLADPAGGVRR